MWGIKIKAWYTQWTYLMGLHTDITLKTNWLFESVLRHQTPIDRAARLQDDVTVRPSLWLFVFIRQAVLVIQKACQNIEYFGLLNSLYNCVCKQRYILLYWCNLKTNAHTGSPFIDMNHLIYRHQITVQHATCPCLYVIGSHSSSLSSFDKCYTSLCFCAW